MASKCKKIKIDRECRAFKEEWTTKYFFMDIGNKAVCLLCQQTIAVFKEYNLKRHHQTKHVDFGKTLSAEERRKKATDYVQRLKKQQTVIFKQSASQDAATEASFVVSYNLAKRNKPFSDGEFLKACMVDCASIMCPEAKSKFENIALSRRSVVRRVDVIAEDLSHQLDKMCKDFVWYSLALDESTDAQDTAQLIIFIRGIDGNFKVTEELLALESLKDTTTGQDLYQTVKSCVERKGLEWSRMASVTTDGAPALTGKNKGMVALLSNKVREECGQSLMSFHCIIHQESLCKAALQFKHIVDPVVSVVNIIRARGLNHRQFISLLEDMDAEHSDVLYHNNVRWLSVGNVLKRVWDLREEIVIFLEMKGIECDFRRKIQEKEWKFELMFAVDVLQTMNELNVKLQGKDLFAHDMYMNVKTFNRQLDLLSKQAGKGNFCHFPTLKGTKAPQHLWTNFRDKLDCLKAEFERRFEDFRDMDPLFQLLCSPFQADVETAPEDLQMEIIEMQSDYTLKEAFGAKGLSAFYCGLPPQFAAMKKFAAKLLSVFGSTYICEQSFSCMKINKSKTRSTMTDTNLQTVMRISTSSLKPDFKTIVRNCDQHHFSH